jgi:hypothetical protein
MRFDDSNADAVEATHGHNNDRVHANTLVSASGLQHASAVIAATTAATAATTTTAAKVAAAAAERERRACRQGDLELGSAAAIAGHIVLTMPNAASSVVIVHGFAGSRTQSSSKTRRKMSRGVLSLTHIPLLERRQHGRRLRCKNNGRICRARRWSPTCKEHRCK